MYLNTRASIQTDRVEESNVMGNVGRNDAERKLDQWVLHN